MVLVWAVFFRNELDKCVICLMCVCDDDRCIRVVGECDEMCYHKNVAQRRISMDLSETSEFRMA